MKGQVLVQTFPICGRLVNYLPYGFFDVEYIVFWFYSCSFREGHSKGFAFPLSCIFHWTCVKLVSPMFCQIELKAINGFRVSRGEAWRHREAHAFVPTPTHTQHECISLISSGNPAENTQHPRSQLGVPAGPGQPSELCMEHTELWQLLMALFFPTCLAHPRDGAVDRAETSRALPPAHFFFSIMSLTRFLSFVSVTG